MRVSRPPIHETRGKRRPDDFFSRMIRKSNSETVSSPLIWSAVERERKRENNERQRRRRCALPLSLFLLQTLLIHQNSFDSLVAPFFLSFLSLSESIIETADRRPSFVGVEQEVPRVRQPRVNQSTIEKGKKKAKRKKTLALPHRRRFFLSFFLRFLFFFFF